MASVVSKLKDQSDTTEEDPASTASASVELLEQWLEQARGPICQEIDAQGLSQLNKQLLMQRGAVGEPVQRLRETSKSLAIMASVVSKLKAPLGRTEREPVPAANVLTELPKERAKQVENFGGTPIPFEVTEDLFVMSSSIGEKCTKIKQEYDSCFNSWYSEKFLKGDVTPQCDDLFFKYKDCLMKVLEEKKLDTLLADARKDNPFPNPSTPSSSSGNSESTRKD
ncbi:Mitochondrial distribution and morphology protein 35 [Mortierella sp. NVP85]|nr:Mitochondrial distribution and morphology protein 35 [Mortierella sp. NVP85]